MAKPRKRSRLRSAPPRIEAVKDSVRILCPFCQPPHEILPDRQSPCGTSLELKAVQRTFTHVACALCGQSQGTLVKRGERMIHDYDCTPGAKIYTVPPPRSRMAGIVWKLPTFFHRLTMRSFGVVPTKMNDGTYAWDVPQVIQATRMEPDGEAQR